MFDLVGRKITLLISSFLICVSMALIPWTAPSIYPWLYITRVLLGIAAQPIVVHPLTNDYVKKESRGTAVSFNSLAVVLGEIISIGVLF